MPGVNVAALCRRVGMSRQNFYARRKARQRQTFDAQLVADWVRQERQVQPRLGARKLHYLLQEPMARAGIALGRDRFLALLRQESLLLAPLPREWARTTSAQHGLPVYANLLKDLALSGPNQVWVSDLTYVRTAEGFLFLALVTDKASRKIVGYHCAENLEASGCVRALEMALLSLPSGARPIHHSDRGTQYCSRAYVGALAARGLPISMTEKNHCAENALAERMNGILKGEYGLGGCFVNKAQARRTIDQGVWLYNQRRPHTALGYQTPAQAHSLAA